MSKLFQTIVLYTTVSVILDRIMIETHHLFKQNARHLFTEPILAPLIIQFEILSSKIECFRTKQPVISNVETLHW